MVHQASLNQNSEATFLHGRLVPASGWCVLINYLYSTFLDLFCRCSTPRRFKSSSIHMAFHSTPYHILQYDLFTYVTLEYEQWNTPEALPVSKVWTCSRYFSTHNGYTENTTVNESFAASIIWPEAYEIVATLNFELRLDNGAADFVASFYPASTLFLTDSGVNVTKFAVQACDPGPPIRLEHKLSRSWYESRR